MALLKPISTDYGVYAYYWKISNLNMNLDGSCDIIIHGYYNEDVRRANQLALKSLQFSINAQTAQIYFLEGLDMHQVYQYLKTTGEFSNAEDA